MQLEFNELVKSRTACYRAVRRSRLTNREYTFVVIKATNVAKYATCKQRNVTDYSGDLVTAKEREACLLMAQSL